MTIERKSLDATIQDVTNDATDEKPFGGFLAIASDPSLDRDKEVLPAGEWLPLPDHITIDTDHGLSVATTIGSAHPYFDGDNLMIDAAFSSIERAQEVRTLIKEGHIRTVSVATLIDRSQKSNTPRRELLNVGVVAVPANRNAVILNAKAVNTSESITDAAVKFLEAVEVATKAGTATGSGDNALVQAIHDAAGHLGAACVVVEVEADGDSSGADDGANKGIDGLTGTPIDGVVEIVKSASEGDEVPAFTLEQFKTALAALTSVAEVEVDPDNGEPQGNSPAEPPAEEAAAATDEVPAPADEAAGDAAESEVAAVEKRASRMAMSIFASEVLSD